MPPHCDSLDGPVVRAASAALDAEDVDMLLPYVKETAEAELRRAFELAVKARTQGAEAREVADRFLFETAVRLHRAGEGAAFTGLKPAGLDVGPVIPLAEAAIASGDVTPLADFLGAAVRSETAARFDHVVRSEPAPGAGVPEVRTYVEAVLGLQVWAHKLHGAVHAPAHENR